MDGRIFLAVCTLVCVGGFLQGLRFARMTRNPWAGQKLFGMPVEGSDLSVEQVRNFGRLFMIVAPLMWCLFAAACFGLLGPVNGITPIQFVTE